MVIPGTKKFDKVTKWAKLLKTSSIDMVSTLLQTHHIYSNDVIIQKKAQKT